MGDLCRREEQAGHRTVPSLVPQVAEDDTGHSIDQNQKVREDFYDALTEFGMCLKLALSSRTFFEDGAFDEKTIQNYKRDLRFFTELRVQAKRDAQETVDFSEYEDQIRRIVDKQVIGQEVVDPEGFIRVDTLGQSDDPDDWTDEKTRTEADVIKTRIRKTIEQDLIDDPYVLIHELAHLKHHDHGPAFWKLIDAHAGDWRKAKHHLDGIVELLLSE